MRESKQERMGEPDSSRADAQPFNCSDCAEYYLLHLWKTGDIDKAKMTQPRFNLRIERE
jgi:hypothetical protein